MRPTDSAYRPDIDGLRALAVLAVVGYHASPGRVTGGFVGVDVFFVISGYLITRVIALDVDAGSFSFAEFYSRRARRIFPALIVVLIATMALGWLMLMTDELQLLGKHVVAGALFSSNFLLWHEAGYFDIASTSKPLLHLWSLGIEEQFYLVWPVTLIAIWRARRYRLHLIAAIALASFALNVARIDTDAVAVFYAPWTRIWELMIGALLGVATLGRDPAVAPTPMREAASVVGMALIVISMLRFNSQMAFPGWYALAPTTGTALSIGGGPRTWINRRFLSNRVAVFVGLMSYPLYLWHWPLRVFLDLDLGIPSAWTHNQLRGLLVVVVLLATLAATATYLLVELPLRRSANVVSVAKRLSVALCGVAMLGVAVFEWPRPRLRSDPDALRAMAARTDLIMTKVPDTVFYASERKSEPAVLFLGDSHAITYFPAAKHAAERQSAAPGIAFFVRGNCPFLPGVNVAVCDHVYRRSMELAAGSSVRRVIIVSAWALYVDERFGKDASGATTMTVEGTAKVTPDDVRNAFHRLAADIQTLQQRGKEVVLIASHPSSPFADPMLLETRSRLPVWNTATWAPRFATSFSLADFRKRAAWIDDQVAQVARTTGATLVDPAGYLCPNGVCMTVDEPGTPLRVDSNHLRPFAAIRYLTYVPSLVTFEARPTK